MKNLKVFFVTSFCCIALTFMACKKEEINEPLSNQESSELLQEEVQSRAGVPTGWTEITGKRKKGCKLYQKSGFYVQEIDLSQGAQIKLKCEAVLLSNGQPSASTNATNTNPSPWVLEKTVSSWYSNNSTITRLWSFTNATFFGYGNGTVSKSSLPVKASGTIMTCGMGSNPLNQPKRVFYVNWNSTTNQQTAQVSTINLGTPTGTGSTAYYPLNTINSLLTNYATAIVGFDPLSEYGSGCPLTKKNGRTYVGVNGSKVYFFVANFNYSQTASQCLSGAGASQQAAHDALVSWGCSSSKIVMFDGSGSSQMTCLGSNYATGDSRKVASAFYVTYGQ